MNSTDPTQNSDAIPALAPAPWLGVVLFLAFFYLSQNARWDKQSFAFRILLCNAKYGFLIFLAKARYHFRQMLLRLRLLYYRREVIAELRRSWRRSVLDDHVVQLSQMVDVFHNGVWTPNDPSSPTTEKKP